jgi:hypothetical protein
MLERIKQADKVIILTLSIEPGIKNNLFVVTGFKNTETAEVTERKTAQRKLEK